MSYLFKTLFTYIFLIVSVLSSDHDLSSDHGLAWRDISSSKNWKKKKRETLGPIKIYKTQEAVEEEDDLERLFKKARADAEDEEIVRLKLDDDFYLYSKRTACSVSKHERVAFSLGEIEDEEASDTGSVDSEESDDAGSEIRSGHSIASVYVVNADKKTFLIPFGNGRSLLVNKELGEDFGSELKRRMVTKETRIMGESTRNLETIVTDETRLFHQPILTDPLSVKRVLQKRMMGLIEEKELFALFERKEKKESGAISFYADHIQIRGNCKIEKFPEVCKKIARFQAKRAVSSQSGLILLREKEEIEKLFKNLTDEIKKGQHHQWMLLFPENIFKKQHRYGFFERKPTDGEKVSSSDSFPALDISSQAIKQRIFEVVTDRPSAFRELRLHPVQKSGKAKSSEDKILLYKSIYASVIKEGTQYILDEGKWYRAERLNLSLKLKELEIDLGLEFKKASDKTQRGESSETAFNFRIGREKSGDGFFTTDRLLVPYSDADCTEKFGNDTNSFEPFDLIDLKNNRLITVKMGTSGSDSSHLFAQGLLAAQHFQIPEYRQRIEYFVLACEVFKRAFGCEKFDGSNGFFKEKGVYSGACDFMNDFCSSGLSKLREIARDDFTKELLKAIQKYKDKSGKPIISGKRVSDIIREIDNDDFKRFFSASFDPGNIEVVFAFVVPKDSKITSTNVKKSFVNCSESLRKLGYRTQIAYIPEV